MAGPETFRIIAAKPLERMGSSSSSFIRSVRGATVIRSCKGHDAGEMPVTIVLSAAA
jgi:hypothetical protein